MFGGTHPGHWEKPIEAYQAGLSNKLIVTGGYNPAANHPQWNKEFKIESHGIVHHLIVAGIPPQHIVYEEKSTNTLENVLYAREVFNFEAIESVLFMLVLSTVL